MRREKQNGGEVMEDVKIVQLYWDNDSITEIAKQFHVKENAVSMTLRLVRAKLQKYLIERGYDV